VNDLPNLQMTCYQCCDSSPAHFPPQIDKLRLLQLPSFSRVFAVAAASATVALGVLGQPEAQAKRNKPAPAEEKKKEEEDKSLGAYDARLLANARRKEAMKAAKSIASAE
jgi:hypothetical protein